MRTNLPLYIIILATLVSGCVNLRLDDRFVLDENDWYTTGKNESRQHRAETTVDPPLVEKWRYDLGAGVGLSGALVIDGVILVGTRKGQILALDLESGKRLGRARFEAPIEGGMSYSNSVLYLPFVDKKKTIIAYDIYKGDQVWRLKGAPVETSVLAGKDVVAIVDSDAMVKGVGVSDGETVWERELETQSGILAAPLAENENLIVATENGSIYKLELSTGKDIWSHTLSQPVYSTPAIDKDHLFISTTRGKLYSLLSTTGEEEWVYSLSDSTVRFASPAFDNSTDQLVFAGSDGIVRSLDRSTGEERWTTPLEGAIIIAPLFTNNTIYIGTLRGKLYALDKTTGNILWEHKVTGRIKSAIIAQDKKIVVMAETQQLFVFEHEIEEQPTP